MFETVESVVTRLKPTSAFINHLAESDLFLSEEEQYIHPHGIRIFVLQGTKQYPTHTMKKPPSGSAFRGSDGVVPYSASSKFIFYSLFSFYLCFYLEMKATKWFLDLDNNVDDTLSDDHVQLQQYSTAKCKTRLFPHHDHCSLIRSVASKGDVYSTVLSALIKSKEEFTALEITDIDNGNWELVRSSVHKPASLIIFRYNGTLFPSLVPEIVEHEQNYKVRFDQAVSNGDANFTPLSDPKICKQSFFHFTNCNHFLENILKISFFFTKFFIHSCYLFFI